MGGKDTAAAGFAERALAAALLIFFPVLGRAALVMRYVPGPAAAVRALLRDLPAENPCAGYERELSVLENSVVEAEAQHWAYLMRQEDYAPESLRRKPGDDFADPEMRSFFFKRLASWFAQDEVADLPSRSIERIDDASMRMRLLTDMCR